MAMRRTVPFTYTSSRRRFAGDDWEDMPIRTFDQRFGDIVLAEPDFDFDQPMVGDRYVMSSRPTSRRHMEIATMPTMRVARTPIPVNTGDMQLSEKEFKIAVDVSHFAPEDIEIKIVDNELTVHGKHEEKQDDHGKISREFTRRYTLPPDVDPTSVTSSLGQDGVLAIQAPRNPPPPKDKKIPISVEQKQAIGGAKGGK